MEQKSEDGVDLASCQEILRKAEAHTVELIDSTTGCVIDRVDKVIKSVEPLRAKFADAKKVLSEFTKETAECVSDPNTSSPRNIACLTDVSTIFHLYEFLFANL